MARSSIATARTTWRSGWIWGKASCNRADHDSGPRSRSGAAGLDLLPDLIGQKIDRGQRLGRPRRHQDLIQRRVDEIGRIGGFQRRKAGLDLLDEQLGQGLGQIPLRRAFEDHADQEPGLTRRLGLVQGKDDLRLG